MREPKMPSGETSKLNWEELKTKLEEFGNEINNATEILGISHQTEDLKIDHACVRYETKEQVENLLTELADFGEVVTEAEISGRIINTFRLNEPVTINGKSVKYLEIPNPKEDHNYDDGWEHIEFVLDNVEDNTEAGIEKAFFAKFPNLNKSSLEANHKFRLDTPKVEGEQVANPTVSLKVNGIGLKFHAQSIGRVINDPKYEN